MANNISKKDWFFDSGATAHMVQSKTMLIDSVKPTISEVKIANNQKIKIDSVGKVEELVQAGNKVSKITFENVQYVPELCVNLISISQIVKKGHSVLFNINGCEVLDSKENVIATRSLVDNMFKLNNVAKECAYSAKANKNYIYLWHRRLGHASVGKMKRVLNCSIKEKEKCEIRVKGKATRTPFKDEGTRAEKLLERIHSDVCGPMSVPSFSGAKYFVSFIDCLSRKVFVYTMKSKSEVFAKFMFFKPYAENQLNLKIKIPRSDNGKEYVNKNFEELCVKE